MELRKVAEHLYVPTNFGRFHHYYADENGEREYTGITTILGVIAKPALINWAARMACDHIMDTANDIKEALNAGDIDRFQNILDDASKAHAKKRDKAADDGTDVHALIEKYVGRCIKLADGDPMEFPPSFKPFEFAPIAQFIGWARSENIRFIASEQRLYSRQNWIAGTADLIFEKDGKTYIGDIKTYKKLWDRLPMLQMAGYALMWEEMQSPLTSDNVIAGYCVIRMKDGEFETRWGYDTEGDTAAFLAALRLYRTLQDWQH